MNIKLKLIILTYGMQSLVWFNLIGDLMFFERIVLSNIIIIILSFVMLYFIEKGDIK